MVCVVPPGKVRRLLRPCNQLFFLCVCLSALSWPQNSCQLTLLFFTFQPSCPCFAIIFHGSFYSLPDSSPSSVLEDLRQNLATIGATLPPPALDYSFRRAYALAQGTGEGMLTFAGQASGDWICVDFRVSIVGYQGGLGDYTAMAYSEVLGFKRPLEI